MLSLGPKPRADTGNFKLQAAGADAGGVVLPRLLRKPVRHLARLFNHGASFQPRYIAAMTLLIVGGIGASHAVESGLGEKFVAKATANAGFRIEDVEIAGVKEVSRIDVLTNIDLGPERSLFSFDVHKARDDLRKLPWVWEARVAKAYPDRLVVDIVERVPFAVWQNDGQLWLVERDGNKIAVFDERYAALPLVVGIGAAQKAAEFIAKVSRHKNIAELVKAHVRVGERRWNLILTNGVTILLPAGREEAELGELARIESEASLLSRDIGEVDMRLVDRMVVRLSPQAVQRLEAEKPPVRKTGKDT